MLTASFLDVLPEVIVALYAEYEQSVINDIARRLAKLKLESATWQVQRLSESGLLYDKILEELAKVTGKSEIELRKLFEKAGLKAMSFDDSIYLATGLRTLPLNMSPAMVQVLKVGLQKTMGLMKNLTMSTALVGQQAFLDAADLAYLQVSQGAMSYDQAIIEAIEKVATDGLTTIEYANGYKSNLDVAMRRTVLTGVSQTTGKLQEARADEMGQDLVQTSAHIGARPSHTEWQGKVFSRSGTSTKYPDFVSSTGYGTGSGLMGWNCRHSFYPFFEGISQNAYNQETLDDYEHKFVIYNDNQMSIYEATQYQRNIERKIRFYKRVQFALEAAGKGYSPECVKALNKVAEWQGKMRDFIKQTGLSRQSTREQV